MKKTLLMGTALCMVLAMTSCKSKESAYKKAFEKAQATQTTTPTTAPTQTTTNVTVAPVTPQPPPLTTAT